MTVTVQEAEGALSLVPAVAVMMAVPSATAVTKPASETVATLVLLLVQTTSSVVFSGSTVAVSVAVLGLCVTVQGQGGGIQVDAGGRRNKTVLGTLISVPDRLQHRILIAIGACFSDNSLSAVEQSIIGKGHQIFCTVTRVLAHGIMDTDRSISVNGVVRYGDQGVLGTVQIRGTPVASNLNRHIAVA